MTCFVEDRRVTYLLTKAYRKKISPSATDLIKRIITQEPNSRVIGKLPYQLFVADNFFPPHFHLANTVQRTDTGKKKLAFSLSLCFMVSAGKLGPLIYLCSLLDVGESMCGICPTQIFRTLTL